MPFFILNNTNIQFVEKELTYRSYTANEILLNTSWVKFINKKEFAKAQLDERSETFIVYIVALKASLVKVTILPSPKAQISNLIQDQTLTKVSLKYANHANVFSFDLTIELP